MSEQKEVAIIELPKITVKLSATKIVEEEKEIEVPAFVKYSNLIFYKIISQTKMICVTCSESGTFTEIEIKDNVVSAFSTQPYHFITESEFNAKYAEAMKRITEQSGVNL